jgi:exonuclease 3'-5' domain-containing protein 2
MRKIVSKDRKIYGGCKVLHPDGHLMFRCGDKKLNWYLERGLGEMISENPRTIKLTFEPKGTGYHKSKWGLSEMNNICVDCGTDEFLTRHHVIPYSYRKHFPVELKTHNFHDVLAMCITCHDEYERKADILKQEIADEYDVPVKGLNYFDRDGSKMKRLSHCLLNPDGVPESRVKDLRGVICDHYGWKRITRNRLEDISTMEVRRNIKTHGEMVCAKIEDHQKFIEMWRNHFIENNSCEYLSENWSITYIKGKF